MRKPWIVRSILMALISLGILLIGVWLLRDGAAEKVRRKAWEQRALSLRIPVYPERRVRLWLPVPRSLCPTRRETIVQVETETEVQNLMSPELADSPYGLVIMEMDISESDRQLLAERYPDARIVKYPNMPP